MLVVMLHDRPAVGDRNHDGARQPGPDQPVERELIALVERGGGLVEEDHRGLVQQNAGERDALLLAGGEHLGPVLGVVQPAGQMSQCDVVERADELCVGDLMFGVRIGQHRPEVAQRQVGRL